MCPASGQRGATGLLDEQGDGVRLMQQTQAAGLRGILFVSRIDERAAPSEYAMHFGNHRRDPAHVKVESRGFSSIYWRTAGSQKRSLEASVANSRRLLDGLPSSLAPVALTEIHALRLGRSLLSSPTLEVALAMLKAVTIHRNGARDCVYESRSRTCMPRYPTYPESRKRRCARLSC